MKYIKDINESIQLGSGVTEVPVMVRKRSPQNPLGINNYYLMTGQLQPERDEYYEAVRSHCTQISMEFMGISEKSFDLLDRLYEVVNKTVGERQDEFDTIVHNCKNRNYRAQYCAETAFHTIIQGRLKALAERPFAMGGFAY